MIAKIGEISNPTTYPRHCYFYKPRTRQHQEPKPKFPPMNFTKNVPPPIPKIDLNVKMCKKKKLVSTHASYMPPVHLWTL